MRTMLPFSAVVGQDELKLALVLVAIDPTIGGVLITGDRGTAKSTVARGIAALLPRTGTGEAAPFVELPLGATEDRLVGSLDVSKALRDGITALRSGLLARAHGGVLYVDEVNLLADHLVDLLLDAAACGSVTIERDGVSATESAQFMLIGTMNPEEGELRPQFLDRFGLCVRVGALAVRETRIAALRQRLLFDDQPQSVLEETLPAEQALRAGILAARERLGMIAITDAHLAAVASQAIDAQLAGIRGDLALVKAARALAAWEGAPEILEEHIRRTTEFALSHRMRRRRSASESRPSAGNPGPDRPGAPKSAPNPPPRPADPAPPRNDMRLATNLVDPDQPGRRNSQAVAPGRVIGTSAFDGTGTLAIVETLTAAVNRGVRVAAEGVALAAADLQQHERRGPRNSHVLFLVDASGSMAVQRRLNLAKAAALGLLNSNYQRRDEVSLMTFRGEGTDLVLPFTRQVASIEQALAQVPSGGRTPLARALLDAAQLLRTREPALLVLLTDGRANVSVNGGDPWEESLAACASLRAACAGALVIDCEPGPVTLGRARVLAGSLGAECVALDALDADNLTLRIRQRLDVP